MTVATRLDRFELKRNEPVVDDPWLVRRLLAGWTPQAVAAASGGRISLRTAYRWKRSLIGLTVVRAGGWEADFAIRRQGPLRITAWRPVR